MQFRRHFPIYPLQRHDTDDAADTREYFAALSGISRGNRLPVVTIQRLAPVLPPASSATKWRYSAANAIELDGKVQTINR